MSLLEFKFVVTDTRNCPIYQKGDSFELSGVAMTFPQNRKICIFPVKVVADIIASLEGQTADTYKKELFDKEFNCGGCTGLIKFACAKKFVGWDLPQFRLMAEFEAKKALAAKMSSIEKELKDFALLACLDDNGLKEFISCAKVVTYPPGHTLLRVNSPGTNLFLLLSGRVVLLNAQGETVGHLGEGEVFGEMSLMFDQLTNVTVKAVEQVKVMELSAQDFSQLLLKFPFMKMELARMIAKRLSKANEHSSTVALTGLHGQLKELSTPELLQMLHENRKNGQVEFTFASGKATLDFVEGEVIAAHYHDKTGIDAFHLIVLEQEGAFVFASYPPGSRGTPHPIAGFMGMLMEGLRLLDEKQSKTP